MADLKKGWSLYQQNQIEEALKIATDVYSTQYFLFLNQQKNEFADACYLLALCNQNNDLHKTYQYLLQAEFASKDKQFSLMIKNLLKDFKKKYQITRKRKITLSSPYPLDYLLENNHLVTITLIKNENDHYVMLSKRVNDENVLLTYEDLGCCRLTNQIEIECIKGHFATSTGENYFTCDHYIEEQMSGCFAFYYQDEKVALLKAKEYVIR